MWIFSMANRGSKHYYYMIKGFLVYMDARKIKSKMVWQTKDTLLMRWTLLTADRRDRKSGYIRPGWVSEKGLTSHPGMGPRPSGSRQRPRPRPELPRPRRDRDVCQTVQDETETRPRRDRDETLECPRRDRDETFFWSRLYRDTWLIYAWYMHFTLCPKKESLRLGWKKQVNDKQSLILKIPKTFMFLFKWCVLQCFTQIQYCHYNL